MASGSAGWRSVRDLDKCQRLTYVPAKEFGRERAAAASVCQAFARQTKNPAGDAGFVAIEVRKGDQAESVFKRWARRETFREAVFLWMTPLVAARINSGWAAVKAASAAALSPASRASSTLRM